MKNEIINKKFIDRGYNWLRIGDILFDIKLYRGREENIIKNEENYYKNIIYLRRYNQSISHDHLEIAIKLDILEAEFKKNLNISFKELFKQLRECNIEYLNFFLKERSIENTNETVKIVYSPHIENSIENSMEKISYMIACDVINWSLNCTMAEFIEKLMKNFSESNKFSPFLSLEEGSDIEEIKSIYVELNLSDIKEYSVLEIENYIKDTIIEVYLEVKNDGKRIKLSITNPEIQFILKQYLIGFPEFIRKITGKTIQFEIETDVDGLIFKIGQDENQDEIQKELTKYMEFLKDENMNFEELKELNLNPVQLIGIRSFVRAQVMNYRHQFENLNDLLKFEKRSNEFLDKTNERLSETIKIVGGLFEKHIENNKIDSVNISVNNQLENKNNIEIDIQFNENIEKLQESVFEMKNLLNPLINDLLKKELQEIDNDLMEINNSQELNKNKGIMGKLKRFVNGIKEANGTIVLAGQTIAASGEIVQNLLNLKDIVLNIITELMK